MYYYYAPQSKTGKFTSYGTIGIILANVVVYIIENISINFYNYIVLNFGLIPANIVSGHQLYTIITSMFLHAGLFDGYGIFHIFFNMYVLYIFGPDVEKRLGTPMFLVFYFFSGFTAGVFHSYVTYFIDPVFAAHIPTIGASGAIFGVMAGYAVFYPHRRLMTLFGPMNALVLILLFAAIETMFAFVPIAGLAGIAHTAHIGGFLGGLSYALIYKFFSRKAIKKKNHEDTFPVVYL